MNTTPMASSRRLGLLLFVIVACIIAAAMIRFGRPGLAVDHGSALIEHQSTPGSHANQVGSGSDRPIQSVDPEAYDRVSIEEPVDVEPEDRYYVRCVTTLGAEIGAFTCTPLPTFRLQEISLEPERLLRNGTVEFSVVMLDHLLGESGAVAATLRSLIQRGLYMLVSAKGCADQIVRLHESALSPESPHVVDCDPGVSIEVVITGTRPSDPHMEVALHWDATSLASTQAEGDHRLSISNDPTSGRTTTRVGAIDLVPTSKPHEGDGVVRFEHQPSQVYFSVEVQRSGRPSLVRGPYLALSPSFSTHIELDECSITGKLVNASAGPVSSRRVLLFQRAAVDGPHFSGSGKRPISETYTDARGVFDFRGLDMGTYSIAAAGSSEGPIESTGGMIVVQGVRLSDVKDVKCVLSTFEPRTSISGSVVDSHGAPQGGTRVALRVSQLKGELAAITDIHGSFRFDEVPSGEVSVYVRKDSTPPVKVTSSDESVQIVLGSACPVSVTGRDTLGNPVQLRSVTLYANDGQVRGRQSGTPKSEMELQGITSGIYDVVASDGNHLVGVLSGARIDAATRELAVVMGAGRVVAISNPSEGQLRHVRYGPGGMGGILGHVPPDAITRIMVPISCTELTCASASESGAVQLVRLVPELSNYALH